MKLIDDVILGFDSSEGLYSERDVANAIRTKLSDNEILKSETEHFFDLLAFEFAENCQDKDNGWGTYFGPIMTFDNGDGTFTESPSIKGITPDIIEYWGKRANQVKHPVLKSRYSHLVYDFTKEITKKNPDIDYARIVIDSSIELTSIVYEKYDAILFKVAVPKKLARALSIAISINDKRRTKAVVDALISYEDRVGQDDYPATWGFSFDTLISNKAAGLTNRDKAKIIADLEVRLERLSTLDESGKVQHWGVEAAVQRLAPYYSKVCMRADLKRVLLKFGEVFGCLAENCAPLVAASHYEQVRSTFQQYGFNDEARKIDVILHELGPKIVSEFKRVPFKFDIKQEDIDAHIAELIDGDFKTALCRIVFHFVPDKKSAENSLRNVADKCPITFMTQNQLYDHDGRRVANIDSIENDLNGRLISQISQSMQFDMPFLHLTLSGLIEKFSLTTDDIVNRIFESPIFDPDKMVIIEAGIEAYLTGNYLVAAHLLIPQIEAAIRNLLWLVRGSVYKTKPNNNGGFDFKTLGDLLSTEEIKSIFGDDTILYFKILLNDNRGWNFRNDICHGISRAETFQKPMVDRIVHVLLLLSYVKPSAGA